MAKLTVNDIFTELEDIQYDISDISTSQRLRMANKLNYQINEINKSIIPNYGYANYDFATTSGVNRYDLPVDFEDAKSLGSGLYVLNSDGTLGERQQELFPGADGDGYYLGGEVVLLVYTPSIYFTQTPASTQNYRLRYQKELTELTSLADEIILDKRFSELARDFLLKEYAIKDKDTARRQEYEQSYSISEAEYIKNSSKLPGVYSI